jgi:MYXO-CTERM domain-containing protein
VKTQKKSDRKINSITQGRWAAYATAAAASGFATTHTAEATIHYSGLVNQNITGDQEVTFPLNPAGGSFVARHHDFYFGRAGGFASFKPYGVQSASVNGVYLASFGFALPIRLNRSDAISAAPFAPVGAGGILAWDYRYSGSSDSHFGYFERRGVGLIGFKFNNGAGDQYGWVRVKMLDGRRNMFSVVDYAYGDPGDVVLAGQKSDDSAPGLESLGGLALGAVGLLCWRRRR